MKASGYLLSVPSTMFGAWVISKLWLWFMVPLGVPPITWGHAWGLWIIPSITMSSWFMSTMMSCTCSDASEKFPEDMRPLTMAVGSTAVYLVALGWGYLVWLWGMPH